MPICHIIAILESEKDCEEIRHAPQLLYVSREQNRDLTEDLDRAVLKSKEGVREKMDAIGLLICIAILYPEECEKNEDIYDLMYEKQDEINVEDKGFLSCNIKELSTNN